MKRCPRNLHVEMNCYEMLELVPKHTERVPVVDFRRNEVKEKYHYVIW